MTARDGSKMPFPVLTVFNAALSFLLNWEGNFRSLEAQTESSLENPANMGTSVDEVLAKLNRDPQLVRQFHDAYGHSPDRTSLLDAIATYERSLVTSGSRFNRWLGGNTTALTAEEQNGYGYLKRHHPEILSEFRAIVAATSLEEGDPGVSEEPAFLG